MNDASELEYAYQLYRAAALKRIGDASDEMKRLVLGPAAGGPKPIHKSYDIHREGTFCMFCLSGAEDSLEQWRGYGGESGVAIGFKSAELKKRAEAHKTTSYKLVRCVYPMKDELPPPLEEFLSNYLRDPNRDVAINSRIRLKRIAVEVKHWKFREEKEWRLVSDFVWPRDLDLRPSKARVVPFKRIQLVERATQTQKLAHGWANVIQTVCVGPGRHKELTYDALRRNLDPEHITVVPSEIPYRDLY